MDTIRTFFFPKSGHFFRFPKKASPSLFSSCAPGVPFSRQIRTALPLIISEKSKGDAGKVDSSFAQNIFRNQKVYSSPESPKWESYKSDAVSERCFTKQLFCKILSCKIAVLEMLKRYKIWLRRTVKHIQLDIHN